METKIYDPCVPWQVEACLAYVCGYSPFLFLFCVILYGDVSDVGFVLVGSVVSGREVAKLYAVSMFVAKVN